MMVNDFKPQEYVLRSSFLLVLLAIVGNLYGKNINFDNKTPHRQSVVSNTQDFLESIKPNTTIFLEPGEYRLSNKIVENRFIQITNSGLIIKNVKNLKITGGKNVTIRSNIKKEPIIVVKDCQDIELENIIIRHKDNVTSQYNPFIFAIVSSENVSLQKMTFVGNPSMGIKVLKSARVKFSDSMLKNMKHRFVTANESKGVLFKRVVFDRMKKGVLVEVHDSTVHFIDCEIKNNRFKYEVVDIGRNSFLSIESSKLIKNTGSEISRNAKFVWLMNNTFANNPELDVKLTAHQVGKTNRNVLYYNRMLSALRQYPYPLYKRNGKWKSINEYELEFDVIVDFKNGYIEIIDKAGNAQITEQFALFKNSSGENVVGMSRKVYGGISLPDVSYVYFYRFNNDTLIPENVTKKVMPRFAMRDFQVPGASKQLFTKVSKMFYLKNIYLFTFDLPRFGTEMKVNLVPNNHTIEFLKTSISISESDQIIVNKYLDSLKTDSIKLKWDRTLSRFVKKNSP